MAATKTRRRKTKRSHRSTWSGAWPRVKPQSRPLDPERKQQIEEIHEALDAIYDETKLPGELGVKARAEWDAIMAILDAIANDHADIPVETLRRAEWPE